MSIVIQHDIFLKYCQRGVSFHFYGDIRNDNVHIYSYAIIKPWKKGVYFEQGIESTSQYFEGNVTMIYTQTENNYKTHIFSFILSLVYKKIEEKRQRNV